MLTNFTSRITLLFVFFAALTSGANAQNSITAYNQVYSAVIKGGTASIGNTSMHIVNGNNGSVRTNRMNEIGTANNGQGGIGYTQYGNDDENMQFADIDGVAATKNSTSADLILPAGTNTIKYARLYWGGRINNSAITASADTLRKVKIRKGTGAYQNILAASTSVDKFAVNSTETIYQSYSDITAYVQSQGAGTFTVADVPATPGSVDGGGKYAGWSIVIAYENQNEPLNSIRIYHGYLQVFTTNNAPATISVTLNDLNVPNNSLAAGDAVMTVMGWEGDGNLGATTNNPEGDFVKVNGITVSNAVNKAANFWNGSISKNGAYVTTRNPNYYNQMGIDIDEVNVGTGYGILPNANSVTITFGTEADQYFPSYFAFKLRVKDPLVTITKTVQDASGNNTIESNEELTYTLTGTNVGPGVANGVYVVDSLPTNVTYVPGSMNVVSGTGLVLGAQTDAIDAADKSFKGVNGTRHYVKFFIGTGSTQSAGGVLQVGQGYTITFKVKGQAIPGSVNNTATAYGYSVGGDLFTDFSTAVIAPAGGPLSVKMSSFTANLNAAKNATALVWVTESELKNKEFQIQRSEDGVNFTTRATVEGNGTTSLRTTYNYTDAVNTNAKVLYYRLRIIDIDGKVTFSQVLLVKLDSNLSVEKMSVYPNPFVSNVKVLLNSKHQTTANFKLISLDGKQVSTRKVTIESGDNVVVLNDLQSLPNGTYILEITSGTEKYIKKIIKN